MVWQTNFDFIFGRQRCGSSRDPDPVSGLLGLDEKLVLNKSFINWFCTVPYLEENWAMRGTDTIPAKWLAKTVHTEHLFPKIKGLKVDQVPETGRQLAQLILPQVQKGQHVHLTEHHQYYYVKGLKVNQIAQTGRQLKELIPPPPPPPPAGIQWTIKVRNILWLLIRQKDET